MDYGLPGLAPFLWNPGPASMSGVWGKIVAEPQDLTQLLVNWRNGDRSALDEMTPVLYDELRRVARRLLAGERPDHTLQPTALVHEAYMRLINHAKAFQAAKREGYATAITLDDALGVFTNPQVDLIDLDHTLDRLTELDPQQGKVVELRYFGGLSIEETAEVMGISTATVKREWGTARLWLLHQMEGPAA